MRVLIDPIYTNDIRRCASAVKMKRIVEYVLAEDPDCFFYWFIPVDVSDEDRAWLPTSERVRYLPLPYFEDRHKEYWHASEEYRRATSFTGPAWDVDVLVTNRTMLVPFLRWNTHRPGGNLHWSKYVVLIEDMPAMSFKMFVPQSTEREGDLSALNGYLQSTKTLIAAYWEKKHILKEAKCYLSAASVKYIQDNMIEATPVQHTVVTLKSEDTIASVVAGTKKFTVSYAGRMVNRDFVDDAFEIILKNWIFSGDTRMILCTVSAGFGKVDHDATKCIEVFRPDREEFWRIMREEADVGVFMSRDEDYSMVMMEPLMQGTPLVLYKAEHAVASVGEDYPFFVNSTKEGYALLRAFKKDYAGMYKKFATWSSNHFRKLMEARNLAYMPHLVNDELRRWHTDFGQVNTKFETNSIVQLIAETVSRTEPFQVVEVLVQLEKAKKTRGTISKKQHKQFDDLRLVFSTHYDVFRLGLLRLGFVDTVGPAGTMIYRGLRDV